MESTRLGVTSYLVLTMGITFLDKRAAFNLNAIRKICLYFLKVMAFSKKDLSYRRKQGYISVHLEDYLPQLFGK